MNKTTSRSHSKNRHSSSSSSKRRRCMTFFHRLTFILRRRYCSTPLPSETTYAFLALCLLAFIFIVVTILDFSSPYSPYFFRFNTSSSSSSSSMDIMPKPAVFMSKFSAIGSAKQLENLIQNITSDTQKNASNQQFDIPTPSLIVAVAVNFAYRKLALNFICNLKRLNISNYIVFAMDRPVFDYLSQRDAHVFFHDLMKHDIHSHFSNDLNDDHDIHTNNNNIHKSILHSSSSSSSSSSSMTTKSSRRAILSLSDSLALSAPVGNDTASKFGTSSFVETSRRKSLLVLRLLTLGYSVLFSDVDVIWVKNPIPIMLKQSDAHFVIQSDTSDSLSDAPLNFNINSGLYLARAAPQTIIAMRAIIKYAYAIRRSEQKAFNYVLCGAFKDHHAGPGTRVGATQCTYENAGTIAQLLALDAFPNGSNQKMWDITSNFTNDHPNVVALHANYINNRETKVNRIKKIGFWFHSDDAQSRDECVIPT